MLPNSIENNLEKVKAEIEGAASRCGRKASDILLVAASKKQSVSRMRELLEAGHDCFGENRFQEAREKIPALPGHCHWHFIGGLQSNKVKDIVRLFHWIHSVDSKDLIDEVQKRAAAIGKTQKILIEVNVGDESSKHGASLFDAEELAVYANEQRNIEIHGFMTVAPFREDMEDVRPYFVQLRERRDEVEAATGLHLPELSMGMTHDFKVAIEEGATMVRIGTGLFGERR